MLFLDVAEDALEALGTKSADIAFIEAPKLRELCIVSIPSFIFTLEAGVGNKTLPMLLLESSFRGNVNNWSSQVDIFKVMVK